MADLRELYDRSYFYSNYCEGSPQFMNGRGLSPLKTRQVAKLAPGPGRRVLDAGCGRGEVLLACADAGAEVAGIDFSPDAIAITRDTLGDRQADLREGDVTRLPWPDESFDAALSGDVIEHLHRPDGLRMLSELRRVLRPGGTLILHTAPNRLFLDVTWPLLRRPMRLRYPDTVSTLDHWIAESKRFHFNEQSLYGLRRDLRAAGFARPHVWIDANLIRGGTHHLTEGLETSRAVATGTSLTRLRVVRLFAGNDLWAVACK